MKVYTEFPCNIKRNGVKCYLYHLLKLQLVYVLVKQPLLLFTFVLILNHVPVVILSLYMIINWPMVINIMFS